VTVQVSSDLQEGRARWRSAVAGVLAKSTRRDPAGLPAEPERLLDSPTYEGFPIRPLYTSLDARPEPSLPGQWPYARGGDAVRDVKSGWKVAEAFRPTAPRWPTPMERCFSR
jgi:methylmalonyl-CoA mutase